MARQPERHSPREQALLFGKNISVTAGAGSGKTRILVDRFLKTVLEEPRKIRRVLVITFTDKAAGELEERIAADISERLNDTAEAGERLRLLYLRDHLNAAWISTIHGFCSKILHEFPFEAGLAPDFRVLSDLERLVLTDRSIDDVMEAIDTEEDEEKKQEWETLFTAIPRPAVSNMLRRAISRPFEMERIALRFRDYSGEQYLSFLEAEWRSIFSQLYSSDDLRRVFNHVHDLLPALSPDPSSLKGEQARESLKEFHDRFLHDPGSLPTAAGFLELIDRFTTGNGLSYKNMGQLGGQKYWGEMKDDGVRLSRLCEPLALRLQTTDPGAPPSEADLFWFPVFQIFLHLYETVREGYQQLKTENGTADFDDLQIQALRILQKPEVHEEIYQRFDAVMVDEFQDTDRLQWEIIKTLASEDGKTDQDKLFIVGDPKQSIYGFRNADIRVFREVKEQFARDAGHETAGDYDGNIVFHDSYRFLPGLNAFINHLFSHVLREDVLNPYEVPYQLLESRRELPGTGQVEAAILQEDEENPYGEPHFIAAKIQELMKSNATCYIWQGEEVQQPVCYGDIAILLRSRTHLLEIEQALRARNIPFRTVGGIGFWQRQEILDFYHLLRLIHNPADDLALVAVLRARFFMVPDSALYALSTEEGNSWLEKLSASGFTGRLYTDEERILLRRVCGLILKWIALRDRISLSDLLFTILEDTAFRAVLAAELNGEQLVANADKLIGLAQSFDQSGLGGLGDFIDHLDELIDQEIQEAEALVDIEDRETVKIMTIHAAKGLQFPIVFVPYLNSAARGSRESFYINPDLGLASKIRIPGKGSSPRPHCLYNLLKLRQNQKDLAEAKRLFYVAASRAANILFLSATVGKEIRRDTALFWMDACFSESGCSLNDDAEIDFGEFSLRLHHDHEPFAASAEDTSGFSRKIAELQERVRSTDPAGIELPRLMQPLESRIEGRYFSATMIMTYLRDPDAYYRRYHLGFFEGDYEMFVSDEAGGEYVLLLGKLVHRYLERREALKEEAGDRLERLFFEFDITDPLLRERLKQELAGTERILQTSRHAARILNAPAARNEIPVTMRLGGDYLTGTLDRIMRNEQGLWEVVDYKTNRVSRKTVPVVAEEYDWQVRTYALLVSRLFPEQKEYPVSLFFIRADALHTRSFHAEEIPKLEHEFERVIEEIKTQMPVHPGCNL